MNEHISSVIRNIVPHTLELSDSDIERINARAEADSDGKEGIARAQAYAVSVARQKRAETAQ